ncbi:MAG: hypothetical protein V1790_08645 [Planctomycetota bacterium]
MTFIKCIFAVLVTYCVTHTLLAFFPDPLFPYQHTYRNFTVHMREEIPPQITGVLDRVESLLAASEINDRRIHHEIYIFNSFRLSRYLLLRNVHFGCNLPNGHTFITWADVANDIARCELISPDDRRIRTLSESIAHEITHALIRNHVGWLANWRLPAWVSEGYCEYVADGSAIDHRTGLSMMKSSFPLFTPGLQNFRYRLAVEYLIKGKHMTITEMLRSPPDYRETEAEVIAGLREDEKGLLKKLGSRIGGRERPGYEIHRREPDP